MSESLTEFLLARIAEDEATYRAEAAGIEWLTTNGGRNLWDHLLAECEAKRRIVDLHSPGQPWCECGTWDTTVHGEESYEVCPTLRLLALPHADHPDYREEWKP